MDKAELLDSIADYLLYDSYGTPASGRCSKKGFFSVPNLKKLFLEI